MFNFSMFKFSKWWTKSVIEETIQAIWDFTAGLKADTISESGSGNGVTIDGVKCKDGYGYLGAVPNYTTAFLLSHINCNNSADYAVIQTSSGYTLINCKTGTEIRLCVNDSPAAHINLYGLGIGAASAGEKLEVGKDTDVSAIVGRGKLGYTGIGLEDNFIISHIDRFTSAGFGLKCTNWGGNILNGESYLYLQISGQDIATITNSGLALSPGKVITTIYVSDTDSDTDDVLSTGITTKFGLVLIKETTGNKFCLFRIKGDNSAPIIIDGDAEFAAVKDNASTYNFYYESDQFKLQNKVGDNKALYVGLYLV